MRRVAGWLLFSLLGQPVVAQQPIPSVLGVEAHAPAPAPAPSLTAGADLSPTAAVPLARSRIAGVGAGLSGALRVLVSATGHRLEPYVLANFGGGWEYGHRWIEAEGQSGPRVLGDPAFEDLIFDSDGPISAADFVREEIRAPDRPGVWQLESGTGSRLTVITQTPARLSEGGRLNGYHIGAYPTANSGRSDAYAPPTAFIEVTPENRYLPVSKHLTLSQFLTKDQFDVWPKYVALDLRLVDKLELVLQELNLMGVRAERIHVMSGFRTPQYNGPGGGGRAGLSRHMWGDAADVWIDSLGDGQMDDLNGDGRIDMDDAAVILRAVERVEQKYPELIGGAGTYPNAPERGPYIHIDARGYHSRW